MRAEQSRADNIDILKAICAFLVVSIHVPFPGEVGTYFKTLCRIAVPAFFAVTGYFYHDIVLRGKEKKQIKKICILIVEGNLLFLIWNIIKNILKANSNLTFLEMLNIKDLIKLLFFNVSPLSGHLWYLNAILYVLIIALIADIIKIRKSLCFLVPILLLGGIVSGAYSSLLFHREFAIYLSRNFLFMGIPYFYSGYIMKKAERFLYHKKIIWLICMALFSLTTLLEGYVLTNNKHNVTGDIYISTTFLMLSIFAFTIGQAKNAKSKTSNFFAKVGRNYSTWIYILHPILIDICAATAKLFGIHEIYKWVAPIIVYFLTLLVLMINRSMKKKICSN